MKCPNCKNEVSPDWKRCPYCDYLPKLCNKPGCKSGWLPKEAHFCPVCGSAVMGEEKYCLDVKIQRLIKELIPELYVDPISPTTPKTIVNKDIRKLFFPLKGLTLGKTTIVDAKKKHLKIQKNHENEESINWFGLHCLRQSQEKYIDHLSIKSNEEFPREWTERHNLTFNSSCDEWKAFFQKNGFLIEERRNVTRLMKGTDSIVYVSSDEQLSFMFLVDSKNCKTHNISVSYCERK